jgi:hypothetical protein
MKKQTTSKAATETTTRMYYYRPLAARPGVYKCAGFGAENAEHRAFYAEYFTTHAEPSAGIAAGKPIICAYAGDQITVS